MKEYSPSKFFYILNACIEYNNVDKHDENVKINNNKKQQTKTEKKKSNKKMEYHGIGE